MTTRLRIVALLSLLTLLIGSSGRPLQQGENGLFFYQSGHWVRGEFLAFYQQADDPLLLFGYPITEAFQDPARPELLVQYFQRARMELNTLLPKEGGRVSLAPLGNWLIKQGPPLPDAAIGTSDCARFEDSGFLVCYNFRTFYFQHNGALYFGEPLGNAKEEKNKRIVQYFERGRMEYWYENPAGMKVVLTDVGRLEFDQTYRDTQLGRPDRSDSNAPPTELFQPVVRAFPRHALIGAGQQQTVYVIVQDGTLNPVKGAVVSVALRNADGSLTTYKAPDTDADGITRVTFSLPGSIRPTQVLNIEVVVSAPQGIPASTTTWFRVWW